VYELATSLQLEALQRRVADRLAEQLGREGKAERLVLHLQRCLDPPILEIESLTRALIAYVAQSPLEKDAHLWSSFFTWLPESLLPSLFEVYCFLGRGREA